MEKSKNLQIEGLRGITILIIVIYHLFCRYLQIYHMSDVYVLHYWGSFGVIIFFLISTYFLGKEESEFSLRQYFRKKALRLYPGYFISISISFAFTHLFPIPGRMIGFNDFIKNIFFIARYIGAPYVDGAHWYLYVLVPMIIINALSKKMHLDNSFLFYITWIVIDFLMIKYGLISVSFIFGYSYLGVYIIGIALYKLKNKCKEKNERIKWCILFFIGLAFTGCFLLKEGVIEVILALFIFYSVLNKKITLLEKSIFQIAGNRSYYVYLIHQNISFAIIYALEVRYGGYSVMFSVIALVISYLMAEMIRTLDIQINKKLKEKGNANFKQIKKYKA